MDDAKRRVAGHQAAIAQAEEEIRRLQNQVRASLFGVANLEIMRDELKALRDKNLDEATFEEKLDIISKLGIKVYPSEDLRVMRVICQLNLQCGQSDDQRDGSEVHESKAVGGREPHIGCGKVSIAPPFWTRT